MRYVPAIVMLIKSGCRQEYNIHPPPLVSFPAEPSLLEYSSSQNETTTPPALKAIDLDLDS